MSDPKQLGEVIRKFIAEAPSIHNVCAGAVIKGKRKRCTGQAPAWVMVVRDTKGKPVDGKKVYRAGLCSGCHFAEEQQRLESISASETTPSTSSRRRRA